MKKLIALILFVFAPAALCEELEEAALPPIVVEEEYTSPPLQFPSAFSTVLRPDEFGGEFNTSSEVLSFSPGVQVRDFGGFGQLKTLSIRGSSNDQLVVLLDGVRISSPLGGGVDLSTVPVEYVERFEIVRGGASALAGSDALGGVVNIVTRRTDTPLTRATLTTGSFRTVLLSMSRSGSWGGLGYLLSFTHAQSEGDFKYRSINGLKVRRINSEFISESFLAKFDFELPGGWKLGLLNEFFFDDKGVPGLGEFPEDSSNQRDVRNLTSIKLSKDGLLLGKADFDLVLFGRFDQLDFEDPEPTLGVPIDTLSRTFALAANPRLIWYAPLGQVVTVGGEVRVEVLRDEGFDNPERLTVSAFAGDEITIWNGRVLIHPLVRFDLFRTSGREDSTDAQLSPKIGLIFAPWEYFLIKGNFGRSFRAPSFGELFFPERGFIGGNPELDTETSIDFDAGVVLGHPKIGLELTYFRTRIDNLILFVFISANRIEPRNVGKVDQQGVEASLIARPIKYFELLASYTLLDGELRDTGAQLPGRPRNKLDLRGVLYIKALKLYWEAHFVDKIPLSPFPNTRKTDSRTTYDFGAQVKWKGAFLTFELKNVFDNLDVRDAFDFPLPGRQVYFTGGFRF